VSRVCGLSVWRCAYRLLHLTVVCLQVKLSIVQLVGGGGVCVESVACLLVVAAADSRHRLVVLMLKRDLKLT